MSLQGLIAFANVAVWTTNLGNLREFVDKTTLDSILPFSVSKILLLLNEYWFHGLVGLDLPTEYKHRTIFQLQAPSWLRVHLRKVDFKQGINYEIITIYIL